MHATSRIQNLVFVGDHLVSARIPQYHLAKQFIFQRRKNGNVGFTGYWKEYQYGFGDASGEYWIPKVFFYDCYIHFQYIVCIAFVLKVSCYEYLGNQRFHRMTSQG